MSDVGPRTTELDLHYATADCNGQATDEQWVGVPDWWGPVPPGANELWSDFQMYANAVVVPVPVGIYALQVPVDPKRKLVSVTFAGKDSHVRVFDMQPATTGNVTYPCAGAGSRRE